jgi:hypothetical protein
VHPASPARRRFIGGVVALSAAALLTPPADAAAPPAAPLDLDAFRTLCLHTARANILDRKLFPSKAYDFGTWMRDAYWTLPILADDKLKQYTWERFANGQDHDTGRVPSALIHSEDVLYSADDESTAFFVLLALEVKRAGLTLWDAPLQLAAKYLVNRLDPDGHYRTGPGPFAYWLDTLYLPMRQTVAYNQGIVAVALRALRELGQPLPQGVLERAEAAYAGLYRDDLRLLPLASGTNLLDVSCLVGEHLSLRYFQRPLLGDGMVAHTLAWFRRVTYPDRAFLGFPVASQLDGTYMPETWFYTAPDNWPGYYHNGGSWLLYDAIALDAARHHGVPEADGLLRERIASETRVVPALHEYIATTNAGGHLGAVPFPWRSHYSWNSYVGTLPLIA